jgi:hypothetical protein
MVPARRDQKSDPIVETCGDGDIAATADVTRVNAFVLVSSF